MKLNNEEVVSRIKSVAHTYGIKNKTLSEESDQCIQTILNQMSGKYAVSIDTIAAILRLAPDCNARWLITGEDGDTRIANLEKQVAHLQDVIGSVLGDIPKSTINKG